MSMPHTIGICSHCGASGEVGTQCKYCGSIISTNFISANKSLQSQSRFDRKRYIVVKDDIIGEKEKSPYIIVKNKDSELFGLIDKTSNEFVIPCLYDSLSYYIEENLCCVEKNFKYGVLDVFNNEVIPLRTSTSDNECFIIQDGYIVGCNSIYDIKGNIVSSFPDFSPFILGCECVTSFPGNKGLFDLKTTQTILPSDFVLEHIIDIYCYIVKNNSEVFPKYGIYDIKKRKFLLDTIYSSISEKDTDLYIAQYHTKMQNGKIMSKVVTFSVSDGFSILNETENIYQDAHRNGCSIMLLILILLIMLF